MNNTKLPARHVSHLRGGLGELSDDAGAPAVELYVQGFSVMVRRRRRR